jgi:ABC-type Fe3+ transport system substrate-binding protein
MPGMVALAGDPRASNQAILGVLAAGMSTGAAPGEAAGKAGLEFFKALNDAGNFVPVIGKAGTLAQGTTPIVIMWDYNALPARDTLAGNPPVEVVVPKSGVLAGVYVQAIRLCAAAERREAVDGIPVQRRRSAWLAEGLLPPGALQRDGRCRQDPAGPAGRAAPGRIL